MSLSNEHVDKHLNQKVDKNWFPEYDLHGSEARGLYGPVVPETCAPAVARLEQVPEPATYGWHTEEELLLFTTLRAIPS